ncbi:MAG: PAS domain S-box protein [Proteobacteria bacterium]|nr:PAS domain S-box protein [Pseudomonadota bacterium]
MNKSYRTRRQLLDELQELTSRMMEAEETLRAIRNGEVDGLVVSTEEGDHVFTLTGAEHPYRVMIETMNEGAVTLASKGTILFCNQRFASIVKEPLETIIGSSIYQYISSKDLQLYETLVEHGLKENCKVELELRSGGDNFAPVLLSVNPLQPPPDTSSGDLCMIVTDLTEQKHNEEILAEGKLTTQILEQAAEIFVLCDHQGRIIRASQSANRFLGSSPIFQTFDEVFHLLHPDGTRFVLLSAVSDKTLHAIEVHFEHGDNELASFLLSVNSLVTHGGVIGIIVVMVDVTARRVVEKELQRSQKLFHTIARVSPVGLFRTDTKGQFVYVNEYWSEITNLSADETYGEGWEKALYPEDRERVLNEWHRAIKMDLPFESEFRFLKHNGIIKWVIGRAIAERGIYGERLGHVGTITDITEHKSMEDELQQAYDGLEERIEERTAQLVELNKSLKREASKRKTVGDKLRESQKRLRNLTSHLQQIREQERSYLSRELHDELGQVLTGLKMDVRWIERRLPEDSASITERLNSMLTLVDNAILSVQRLSMALRPPALDDFGLNEAIELLLTDFEKRTDIACEFISTPHSMALDRKVSTEVFRIFQEALTNISRHANAQKVAIILHNTADRFTMEVRDDGKGITKKEITDAASIGLTGIRERVYALEGTLEINGVHGKGTTVTVIIPLKKNTTIKRRPRKTAEEV